MRGFSDEEREEIREQLLKVGLEQFSTYGPKKTTISDLTDPLGIANSTFYLFFDSKEELIEEITHEQRKEFMSQVERELADTADAQTGLETLFHLHATWLEENQFLQQVFFEQQLGEVTRSLPQDKVSENRQRLMEELTDYVEAMRECDGRILRDVDTVTVLGMLSLNAFLVSNRELFEDYNSNFYHEFKNAMISALARGLTMTPTEE